MKRLYLIVVVLCLGFISCSQDSDTPTTPSISKTVNIDYEFTTSLAATYSVKYYAPNLNQDLTEVFYGTSWSKKFNATVNNSTNIIHFIITDIDTQGAFQS